MSDADKAPAPAIDQTELDRLRTENREIRAAWNRRDAEVKALREQAQAGRRPAPIDYGEETYADPEPAPSNSRDFGGYSPKMIEEMRYRQAKTEFLVMNPEARDYWEKINAVINDPQKAPNFAAWDAEGHANYERVFRDIHRDIRWQEMEAAKAKATATTAPAATPRPNLTPTISGGTTMSDSGGLPNPEDMTLEQLYEATQGMSDPEDPIRGSSIGSPGNSSLR